LATKDLHCLNRYRIPGGVWVRKHVSLLCWAGYRLLIRSDGTLAIGRRRDWPHVGSKTDARHRGDPRTDGAPFCQIGFGQGILFAWLPDLERIWPAVFPPTVVAKTKPESIAQELPQETILRKRKRKRRAPQVELAGELLAIVFPRDGWHGMTTATIRHKCDIDPRVKAKLRKDERMLPSPESFDRFMKRANTRRR
jgi:hypothetical protein